MKGKWITYTHNRGDASSKIFKKNFSITQEVKRATLSVTCFGFYILELNGQRLSWLFAPGFDSYPYRIQYQEYDVTDRLTTENILRLTVGSGWYGCRCNRREREHERYTKACLTIEYTNGQKEEIITNGDWTVLQGNVMASDIFDGETYDATVTEYEVEKAIEVECNVPCFLQEGEIVCEHERVKPIREWITPNGERVIDFGQNLSGYVEFHGTAKKGERLTFSYGEELDKDGNFYNGNYRTAKAKIDYVCKEGEQTYKPLFTFCGFRYVRLENFPETFKKDDLTAIAVYSDLKRTGWIESSSPLLNQLFKNIVWGQKGNFLDLPTDCPQRDERQGWTGDAQVFCRTACYNFDCEKFFKRWLKNLKAEQDAYGIVPRMVPDAWSWRGISAGWGEAATVIPYELYQIYGDKTVLSEQFESMKKHVDSIPALFKTEFLWTGMEHFGDWLGLDAPEGSYKGSSRQDFIASAFYAYSTKLVCLAGEVLGENVSKYERLYENIRAAFLRTYPTPNTQTECVLMLKFHLTDNPKAVAEKLVTLIRDCGNHLQTGFVGTPYLLHALSENGFAEVAYELLLREEFPSWLYSVKQGATTVWEHWDGKNEKGEFWSDEMNSFNHYAYGAVADWIYTVAGGITPFKAGFEEISIQPIPTNKLKSLQVKFETRAGIVLSKWYWENGKVRYQIETPTKTVAVLNGKRYLLEKGVYSF